MYLYGERQRIIEIRQGLFEMKVNITKVIVYQSGILYLSTCLVCTCYASVSDGLKSLLLSNILSGVHIEPSDLVL